MKTKIAVWALLCALVPTVARGQESQGCDYHDPVWSPDSERLAFGSNRTGDFEVYTIRRDGSDLEQVTHSEVYRVPIDGGEVEALTSGDVHHAAPKWSPDGRQIVFYSAPSDGEGDLYRMDIGTRQMTRLTTHAALDYAPSWSPDGTAIAFVSQRTGENRIFLTGPDGSAPVLLVDGCGQ